MIATTDPLDSTHLVTRTRRRTWIGVDDRDRELEIVAIDRPDCWLVIHVMPTRYRRSDP